jgi:hypothetical protein
MANSTNAREYLQGLDAKVKLYKKMSNDQKMNFFVEKDLFSIGISFEENIKLDYNNPIS